MERNFESDFRKMAGSAKEICALSKSIAEAVSMTASLIRGDLINKMGMDPLYADNVLLQAFMSLFTSHVTHILECSYGDTFNKERANRMNKEVQTAIGEATKNVMVKLVNGDAIITGIEIDYGKEEENKEETRGN